jgi:transcriptional regulator with XRE-family HTH domain
LTEQASHHILTRMPRQTNIGKFGKYLRRMLQRRGMTQAQFADAMGITDEEVSRYVNDVRMPNVATLVRMADVLDVSLERLVYG